MFSIGWLKDLLSIFWKKSCPDCGGISTTEVVHYLGDRKVSYFTCSSCVEREAVV